MSDESKALVIGTVAHVETSDRRVATAPAAETHHIWGTGKSVEVQRAVAAAGRHYGLDAVLGELMLMGDRLYVTAEGYLRVAKRHPQFDGIVIEPATEAERKAMKVSPDDHCWKATVYRKDKRFPFIDYGRANPKNVKLASQAGFDFLMEMARCRAVRRALKQSFEIGLPPEEISVSASETLRPPSALMTEPADRPPKLPQPDWSCFWLPVYAMCDLVGMDRAIADRYVHAVLDVASLKDFPGSIDDAVERVKNDLRTGRYHDRLTAIASGGAIEVESDDETAARHPLDAPELVDVETGEIIDEPGEWSEMEPSTDEAEPAEMTPAPASEPPEPSHAQPSLPMDPPARTEPRPHIPPLADLKAEVGRQVDEAAARSIAHKMRIPSGSAGAVEWLKARNQNRAVLSGPGVSVGAAR